MRRQPKASSNCPNMPLLVLLPFNGWNWLNRPRRSRSHLHTHPFVTVHSKSVEVRHAALTVRPLARFTFAPT